MATRFPGGWRLVLATAFLLLLVPTVDGLPPAQEAAPARYEAPDGLFSYAPPAGWRLVEVPGFRYEVAAGPPIDGFAPNINVLYETRPGVSLERAVEINLREMRRLMADFELIGRREFVTDSGDRGIEVVGEFTDDPGRLHSTWYFFDAGDRKIVATCSRLVSQPADLDVTFEQAMKSFRVGDGGRPPRTPFPRALRSLPSATDRGFPAHSLIGIDP